MPGILPLILAPKAIPNSLTAQELLSHSLDLIQGLLCKNIKVVSYACDGTETEWSVQKLIKQKASFQYIYRIKHPIPSYDNIVSTIAMINSQLVVMIQVSNHSLKTLRNNLHTGARYSH